MNLAALFPSPMRALALPARGSFPATVHPVCRRAFYSKPRGPAAVPLAHADKPRGVLCDVVLPHTWQPVPHTVLQWGASL